MAGDVALPYQVVPQVLVPCQRRTSSSRHLRMLLPQVLRQQPWPVTHAVAPLLDSTTPIEEELVPDYESIAFYPAQLGEVINNRLRWANEKYVAVKITKSKTREAITELRMSRHVSRADPSHEGWNFVRKLLDTATVRDAEGDFDCFVFEALREPLWLHRRRYEGEVIPPELLKIMLQMILHGLDYLHTVCQVIHTDLKPDNIMVKVEDEAILRRDANDEFRDPLPQKHCSDGRVIYLSRNNYGPATRTLGLVQITDFGLARSGNEENSGCIQAEVYRAPEVILDAGFSYSADIWSLGVILWSLLEGRRLFDAVDPNSGHTYDDPMHLAYITKLLGPPPENLLSQGRRTHLFYDRSGHPLHTAEIHDFTFANTIQRMKGQEKEMFIKFVSRMIKWRPEERSTARELLDDAWLHADFPQE